MSRNEFLVVSALIAVALYATIIFAFRHGNPWLAAGVIWMASPIPMFLLAVLIEHRRLGEVASFRHGSLAFLLGDTIFLPIMAIIVAIGWRKVNVNLNGWAGIWWLLWLLLALVIGAVAGLTFHHLDSAVYSEAALNSPTKLWHDLVAFPVLFGGLTFGFVPIVLRSQTGLWLVALAMFGLWVLAAVSDSTWHKLDPERLHIEYVWPKS